MEYQNYWENYYLKNKNPIEESSFASFCLGFIDKNKKLIDLGCGNGRDSIFFAKNNIITTGVDYAEKEINFLNTNYSNEKLSFIVNDFTKLDNNIKYDYVYSRFTLHSINENGENELLRWIKNNLNKNGFFFLEVRSINDPMFLKGEKISSNENITTHYRRYIDFKIILEKIKDIGLKIIYKLESNNLSKNNDDNPVLIRIIAQK